MKLNNEELKKALLLYAVTDRTWTKEKSLYEQVELALKGGTTFLQLREKDLPYDEFKKEGEKLLSLCRNYSVPFVINDNVELAKELDADGVHIVYYSNVATKIIELCNFMPANILNSKKIQSIYKTLLPYTQVDKEVKEKHITEAKIKSERKVEDKKIDSISTKTKIELPTKETFKCPKCGASLKKITSKKTSKTFWGCSNYPKCKYTMK